MHLAILNPADRKLTFLIDSQLQWVEGPQERLLQSCAYPGKVAFCGLERSPADGKQGAAEAHICMGLELPTAAALNSSGLRGVVLVVGPHPKEGSWK